MIFKAIAIRGAAAFALAAMASGALAQAAPTAAAAPPMPSVSFGPPISGVCVVSRQRLFTTSSVGQSVVERLKTLEGQVEAELQPTGTALQTELKALQATASPDPARVKAWQAKAAAFQQLQAQRNQELQATEEKQFQRIQIESQPVMAQVFQQKQCTILLDGDSSVMAVNPAMDLTPAVILGLNQKITTLTFDREKLPEQAGAQ